MKVLVCGGRDFNDQGFIFAELDELHSMTPFDCVVQGGALGADKIGGDWAQERQIPCVEVKADWKKYGKMAGRIRNADMLRIYKPNLVVAFPGGRGTWDMMDRAGMAGVRIFTPVYFS